MYGGGGAADVLFGGPGHDFLYGGYGVTGTSDGVQLYGEDGDDEIWSTLYGNAELWGGKGDDLLLAAAPVPSAYGNTRFPNRNLNEDFTVNGFSFSYGSHDMQGGPGDDFIMGGYGDDDIYGGEGDDIIYGNQLNAATYGNDYIEGGPGDDFIAGVDAASGTD